jgi:hypothetical protein
MKWLQCAPYIVATLGVYIVGMDWLPLGRWNGEARVVPAKLRAKSSLWHGSLAVLFLIAFVLRVRWLIGVGAIWYLLLLAIELNNWWVPYLFGVNRGEVTPEMQKAHANNIRFLPRIKDRPAIPDAQHVLMQLITISTVVVMTVSFFEMGRAS